MCLGFCVREMKAIDDVISGVRVCQELAHDYGCLKVPIADHMQDASPGMLVA